MLKSIILGGLMLLGSAAAAEAQTVITGSDTDEVLGIARVHGSAALDTQANGDPKIVGKLGQFSYEVFFRNCTDKTACEDLNFYTGFRDAKQPLEAINEWNRTMRFGRAYLDGDLDAVVEFDLNLEGGVTRENIEAAFALWALIVDEYATYIGKK